MSFEKTNIRKQRIIDATIEVIKEKSVEEATVREIAAKAGLTTGAIYHHYKNKHELFYDVINQSIHFIYKLSERNDTVSKKPEVLLGEIQDEVIKRLSKIDEQKIHVLLISDVISKGGDLSDKYRKNYLTIIEKVADMYFYTFGIENPEMKKIMSTIFVAALDGMAIQYSLGVIDKSQTDFIMAFNQFFIESTPAFLKNHLKSNE